MSEASRLGCAQPGHKLHFPVGFLGQSWALLPSAGSVLFQDPGSPWSARGTEDIDEECWTNRASKELTGLREINKSHGKL